MIVIANSSPLVALGRVRQLEVFKQLFKKVYIPTTVYQETVVHGTNDVQEQAILQAIDNGSIEIIRPLSEHSFTRKLHQGEKDVLNIALDMNADLLIIDDKKARNEAIELGFKVSYTSTLIKGAEKRGVIDSYTHVIEELRSMDIYLPEE